jgi:hypothetical protein
MQREKSGGFIARSITTQRLCSASSNMSDSSTSELFASASSAQSASSYGLMVGVFSVSPSLQRQYAFMWLSGT